MADALKYYIACNDGLTVFRDSGAGFEELGRSFAGKTLEYITGCWQTPDVIFAAVAFDGGYRSEDGGLNWTKVLEGDVRTFTVDAHDERVVYAGSGPICLYRSEDQGRTFETVDSFLELPQSVQDQWTVPATYLGKVPPHVRHIYIHPDRRDLIYVLLEHGGVVRSLDGGANWEDVSSGIDYLDMHIIANLPGSFDRYYVSSARGFFRTDDGGKAWHRVEKGMPYGYTEEYSYSHEWMFCDGPDGKPRMVLGGGRGSPGYWVREKMTPHGHILISDDEGESWRNSANLPIDMPYMPWTFLPHPEKSDVLFCGMGDGARGFGMTPNERGTGAVYRSDDRGESWDCIMPDMPSVLTTWIMPA